MAFQKLSEFEQRQVKAGRIALKTAFKNAGYAPEVAEIIEFDFDKPEQQPADGSSTYLFKVTAPGKYMEDAAIYDPTTITMMGLMQLFQGASMTFQPLRLTQSFQGVIIVKCGQVCELIEALGQAWPEVRAPGAPKP